jgi:hypothetical protein
MFDPAMAHATVPVTVQAVRAACSRYLLHGIPLPTFPKQYGPILVALLTSAGAAAVLTEYIWRNRENHAKIKLAVLHFSRVPRNTWELDTRLAHHEQLVVELDEQVMRLVGTHLTQNKTVATTAALKRKVMSDAEGQREGGAKRQKNSASNNDVHGAGGNLTQSASSGQVDVEDMAPDEQPTPTRDTILPHKALDPRSPHSPRTPDSSPPPEDPPRSVGRRYRVPSETPSPSPGPSTYQAPSYSDTEND